MHSKDEKRWQAASHIVLILFTLAAVLPFILLLISSFTNEQVVLRNGFSFFPEQWSIDAYRYIATRWADIGHSYLMTIIVTVVGTGLSILLTSMYAYVLASPQIPGVRVLNFLTIFTMLFSGGIVGSYYIWSNIFHIRDTFFALLLPNLLMNAFNIILVKNYYTNSIPAALREAARIDGCSEFRVFWTIVMPLSVPINATIGLMTGLAYWNDWTNGLYYLSGRKGAGLYTIQILMNQISDNIAWLSQSASGSVAVNMTFPTTTARMAIGVIGLLPILIAYPFLQKYFVSGITVGAVKE